MKILGIIAKWLFIACLPVLLLTSSIGYSVNSLWLYRYGFDKYDASQRTGLAEVELERAARGIISYFNSTDEYFSLTVGKDGQTFELFNQREIAHLRDVKGLIWLNYSVLLGTLIYILGYAIVGLFRGRRRYWRRLALGVAAGSFITLALMLALGLGTLLGFDRLFLQFHLLSFANDFWQLDPGRDYMIMLFPRDFWYDTTLFCALGTVAAAIILGGVSGGYLLASRKTPASVETR